MHNVLLRQWNLILSNDHCDQSTDRSDVQLVGVARVRERVFTRLVWGCTEDNGDYHCFLFASMETVAHAASRPKAASRSIRAKLLLILMWLLRSDWPLFKCHSMRTGGWGQSRNYGSEKDNSRCPLALPPTNVSWCQNRNCQSKPSRIIEGTFYVYYVRMNRWYENLIL